METRRPRGLVSPAEAVASGLEREAPPPVPCPYCSRPLQRRGAVLGGHVYWVTTERCGCAGERREMERDRRREAERDRVDMEKLSERAGVPKRYRRASPGDPRIAAYARGARPGGRNCLYVHGPVGCGKTHEACGALNALAEGGGSPTYVAAPELVESLKDGMRSRTGTRAALARPRHCSLLVLDDLGGGSVSRWTVSVVYELVNARYEEMLPTIYASRYDLAGLRRVLSREGDALMAEGIASRIAETSVDVALPARGAPKPAACPATRTPAQPPAATNDPQLRRFL